MDIKIKHFACEKDFQWYEKLKIKHFLFLIFHAYKNLSHRQNVLFYVSPVVLWAILYGRRLLPM